MRTRDELFDGLAALAHARSAGRAVAGIIEQVEALATELPAGAWTRALEQVYAGTLEQAVVPPVGTCAFPTTVAGIEVAVRVVRAHARSLPQRHPPEVARAVRAALHAARGWSGQADPLAVAFDPPPFGADGTLVWDGASCGLAVALAAVSALRGEPLLPTVWATGCILADGRLRPVDAVGWKARLSRDRTLLVPRRSPSLVGTVACEDLADAAEHATGVRAPTAVARRVRAASADWLAQRGAAWTAPREHDTLLREALARVGCAGIVGRRGSGRTSALVRLVRDGVASDGTLVLAMDAPREDGPAALRREVRALLGTEERWVPDTLLAAAHAVGADRVRICVDGVGPALAEHLAGWVEPAVEVVWTRAEDGSLRRHEWRLPAPALALRVTVLAQAGVRVAEAPPAVRDVLEEPLALEARDVLARATTLPSCRAHLRGAVAAARAAAHPDSALVWPLLGAGALAGGPALAPGPRPPWVADAVRALQRAGHVDDRVAGVHFVTRELEEAAMVLAASLVGVGPGAPELTPEDVCTRVACAPAAAPLWGDAVEARLLAEAPDARWIAALAACVRAATRLASAGRSGVTPPGARATALGVVTLLGAVARADLRAGRADLVRVAAAVAVDRPAVGRILATGAVLGWAFEAHALFARHLDRAFAHVDAVEATLPPRAARAWRARWRVLRAWLSDDGSPGAPGLRLPARRTAEGLPVYALGAFPQARWAPTDAPRFVRFQQAFATAMWRALRRRGHAEEARSLARAFVRVATGASLRAWRRRAGGLSLRDMSRGQAGDTDVLRESFLGLAGVLPPPTDDEPS